MVIEAKAGKKDKVHIIADGEYLLTVDSLFWHSCGLRSGDDIDGEELDAFKAAAGSRAAFNKALFLLDYRDYSTRELRDKLRLKGVEPEHIDGALNRVSELGLVNDEKYARAMAVRLFERKGMSPSGIYRELVARGIPRDIARETVEEEEIFLDFEPKARIIELLEARYRGWDADERRTKRAFDALVRLGYGYADIRAAMREAGEELPDDADFV